MNVRHSLVNLIALLALAGCSQAPTPGATPAATKSPTLKAQDIVTPVLETGELVIGGTVDKYAGQTGSPNFILTAQTRDLEGGGPNGGDGCNARNDNPVRISLSVPTEFQPYFSALGSVDVTACGLSTDIPYTLATSLPANAVGKEITVTAKASGGIGNNGKYTEGTFKIRIVNPPVTDELGPDIEPVVSGTLWAGTEWYTSDVTVTWTLSDPSGIDNTPGKTNCPTTLISADTTGQNVKCVAYDSKGNSSEKTITIKRDATAPTVTPENVTTGVWRNTPLSQEFTASDATSRLLADQPGVVDGKFTLTASADSVVGAPTVVTGSVKDNAGNSTTRSVSALIDTHKPTITAATFDVNGNAITATADGWFRQPVVVKFTCVDPQLNGADQSGVAGACPADVTVNETGSAGETVARTISDVAGNASDPVSLTVKVDTTAPTITATADHSG
ncbi:hypothetical protein [Deinococcus xianganensis]|uniref:HYR domain-containing protein n=1 Tax=Deinococcus xianganensis TaxID=1507289 RepID=A0A6I4YP70_9DEIO|nr:hypothetical protein [Deinococcus xianganensis]MXV20817.1 hypothetical protein [Deinococcus xianganensis]